MKQLNLLNEKNEKIDFINENTSIWEKERIALAKRFIKIINEDYRDTYNYFYEAKVLRTCPNIMILDDHDIYDNFGFDNIDYIKQE